MVIEFLFSLLANPAFQVLLIGAIGAVARWLGLKIKGFLDSGLTLRQREILMDVARQAVIVAEQTLKDALGSEKKEKAFAVAKAYLTAYGIKVSSYELEAAIEAAVYTQLTSFKDPILPAEPVVTESPEDDPEPPTT